MRTGIILIIIISVIVLGAILYVWKGFYNIAATEPHWDITSSSIDIVKNQSISAHSGDIRTPRLDDPEMRLQALPHYHGMCRYCHGAPGYPSSEFAGGLYPAPPKMTSGYIQNRWNDAEFYWIVKNGIKLTGMPAFGPSHSEDELWGLVALSMQMPGMAPDQYRQFLEQISKKEHHHGSTNQHSMDENISGNGHEQETTPKDDDAGHSH